TWPRGEFRTEQGSGFGTEQRARSAPSPRRGEGWGEGVRVSLVGVRDGKHDHSRAAITAASNGCRAGSVVPLARPSPWRMEVPTTDVAQRFCRGFLLSGCTARHRARWRTARESYEGR